MELLLQAQSSVFMLAHSSTDFSDKFLFFSLTSFKTVPEIMSSSSHAESEHCSLLELAQFSGSSTNTKKGKKRWRKAFAFICCSRALDSQKINRRSLVQLVEDKNLAQLEEWGGLDAVAKALKTDLQNGISNVDAKDIAHRQSDYGSNTFKNPTPKSCFHFYWRELLKVKNVILLAIGAISLGLGIAVDGLEDGWSDGGCALIAVLLGIVAATVVKYSLNRQLNKLYKVGSNVQINVVRKGQFQKISAFELVVGDVVCLKIGDQVPADGLLIEGHSLLVEKASEKGEGDIVEVN